MILVIFAMYSYAMILDGAPVSNDKNYTPFQKHSVEKSVTTTEK